MCMCFKDGTILWHFCVLCQLFILFNKSLKVELQITFLFVLKFPDA